MYLADLTVVCNAKTVCFPWVPHNKLEITQIIWQLESLYLSALAYLTSYVTVPS